MNYKKIIKAIFYPHVAVIILSLIATIVMFVCSKIVLSNNQIFEYISYFLSAYTFATICVRLPNIIKALKKFKEENKLIQRWINDTHFKVVVVMYGSLIFTITYSLFQMFLGVLNKSFWFYSLAAYYICLSIMRFLLVFYSTKHTLGVNKKEELLKYRTCGIIFLVMNVALAAIVFFMVYYDRTFIHNSIITITMAAYAFITLSVAIVNVIKFRKIGNPIYSAAKAVDLAAACVVMLTLESTMLSTFDDGTMTRQTRQLLLGITGFVVMIFIIIMAIYMIINSTKQLKELNKEESL